MSIKDTRRLAEALFCQRQALEPTPKRVDRAQVNARLAFAEARRFDEVVHEIGAGVE